MVNDTFALPRRKDKMDENNDVRRTLSKRKELSNCSTRKDAVSSKRRLDRESSFHAQGRATAKSPMELKHLENDKKKKKKKKERSRLRLSEESKHSEMASEKNITGRSYKAQFKPTAKMVVSDTHEAVEGPNTVVKGKYAVGPPASVDSASTTMSRLRDVTVHSHSETVKDCRDLKATETILSPESLNDSVIGKNVCSKRKSFDSTEDDLCSCGGAANKNLGRRCTCKKRAQYSDDSPCELNADNGDVRNKQRKGVNENVDRESVNGEPFSERGAKSVSAKLPDLRKQIGVKSHNEKLDIFSEMVKKCRKRQEKLNRKHQDEIQVFHKIWNEKRDQLDKDLQLEMAFARALFRNASIRTERLKRLNQVFAEKIKNHNHLKDVKLKNLQAEQLAAMNEEKRKREHWLTEAKPFGDELIAVNGPPLIDDDTGVTQLAVNTTVDATRVVSDPTDQVPDKIASESESTRHLQVQDPNENNSPQNRNFEGQIPSENEFTQHLEDQNLSDSVCANANASALTNTSISARVDPVRCHTPTKMKYFETGDFDNKAVDKDMVGFSVVEQSNQLKPLCDNGELVCATLPFLKDQSVNFTVLTVESSVAVPAKAPKENVSQDEIPSSFAEQIIENELAIHNQCDSHVGDPEHVDTVTTAQFNGELEEGEIQEFELEEGQMQEKTMGKEGIVGLGEEEPIMEKQRTVNSKIFANVELGPVLVTEEPVGDVPVVGNQHTSEIQFEKLCHVNDSFTDGELEEGEIQEFELEEGEMQEKTMGKQRAVAIVEPGEEEPIMEKQRTLNSEIIANVEPVLVTEKPVGDVPVVGNQHTSEIQYEKLCHVNDSFTDGQPNVELQELVAHGAEIDSNSGVANSGLVDTIDPAQPISEQPRAYSSTIHTAGGMLEADAFSSEPVPQIELVQPIKEQPRAEAVGSRNTCHVEAPILIQTAEMTELETRTYEAASQIISQIDSGQPNMEQLQADAETVKSHNVAHIEALSSSKELQKGGNLKYIGDHSSDENIGQGPDVNNNRACKTRNTLDKPGRSRSLFPSPDEQHGKSRHSSPNKVHRDSRESREKNIRSRSPVRSSAKKRAHRSDSNDLSRSPSPEKAQKRARKGRGFTKQYASVRKYHTPSPEPDRSCLYAGRDIERNNYSSRAGFVQSPQGRCRSPADDDCSPDIQESTSQIGSIDPVTEQPLGDAETIEDQNACLIQARIQAVNVAEVEALSRSNSQIDTFQRIVELSQADAEVAKSQSTCHIEALLPSQIVDVAEAETLQLKPASQICLAENQNASLIEAPSLSQMDNVAGAQIENIHSIIEQPQGDEETAENQNSHIEVPSSSQIADVVETEALLHEPVSQSVENLATRSISNEHIGEFTTTSESNEPICEGVIGEVELSIEGVPHNKMSAVYLYGSGHLPSLNTHYSDPIEFELGKTIKEKEEFERSHLNMEAQLKSDCEKEIEEMTNQIKQKYIMQFQVAEAEFRQGRSKFDNYLNKLQIHKKLAEVVRNKFEDPRPPSHPINQQGTSSVYMQQMHHLSVHPSLRVIPNALNFQPSPGHSNTSFAGPPIMQHQSLAHPTRFFQITNHSVTAPPIHSRSHPNAGSVRPCIRPPHSLGCPRFSSVTAPPVLPVQHMQGFFHNPPRPCQVISIMPSHNMHTSGEVSSVAAQRHQSFGPSVGPPTSSSIPPYQPMFQNGPGSQDGLMAETSPHLSTLMMRERSCWSHLRPNYASLGVGGLGSNALPGNRSSSVVHDDVVYLSDDDN